MYIKKNISNGYNEYLNLQSNDYGTFMDVGLLVLEAGERYVQKDMEKEAAYLLLEGAVTFCYDAKKVHGERPDTFHYHPWCLHVPFGVEVELIASKHCEIYIQKTINNTFFEPKLYTPEDTIVQRAGANGELMGCMRREIKTLFDYENAPYSNMVLGEVLNYPGKWSSYPPHHHPQPEVYFHRFDYPEGFGVSFANGEVYQSCHNGLTVINHGFHSQGTAPGYAMCYVWGIRHLEGDPWEKTRIDDKEHAWLWKKDANEHIYQEDERRI
ncbi:5-deoxy-glucuronate isomerase [Lachnospiraceae bacterium LCP25S3_G4]